METKSEALEKDSIFREFADLYIQEKLPGYELIVKNDSPARDDGIIRDGITDPKQYEGQPHKILFICKEHNHLNGGYNSGDVREWWASKKGNVQYNFSHRISEWAYGIAKDFPAYETVEHCHKEQALRNIAFINVKKVWGDASADAKVIWKYTEASKVLLQKQIKEINPTIIIACFRYDYLTKLLFEFDSMNTAPHGFSYRMWNESLVINFFHPSSRKNKEFLYNTFKEVVTYSLSN
jgi:hypothetical protein